MTTTKLRPVPRPPDWVSGPVHQVVPPSRSARSARRVGPPGRSRPMDSYRGEAMRTLSIVLVVVLAVAALTLPVLAGEIHGKVSCKGVRDSANAVVYIDAIAGKTFPVPSEHAKIDQKNLVF